MSATHGVVQKDFDRLGLEIADVAALDRMIEWPRMLGDWFTDNVSEYLTEIEENRVFHQDRTLDIAGPRIQAGAAFNAKVDISSSHCMRLNYSPDDAVKLMREFQKSLSAPYTR